MSDRVDVDEAAAAIAENGDLDRWMREAHLDARNGTHNAKALIRDFLSGLDTNEGVGLIGEVLEERVALRAGEPLPDWDEARWMANFTAALGLAAMSLEMSRTAMASPAVETHREAHRAYLRRVIAVIADYFEARPE